RLVLGDPRAVDLVGDRELAGLVVQLDDQVLAEVLQRDLRAEPRAEAPDLVRPALELDVVRDAALERDRVASRAPWRAVHGGGIGALAVLDHLRRALQRRDLADAGDVAAVPLHAELEVRVGVEPSGVHGELGHGAPQLSIWPASCWIWTITNSAGFSG